MRTVFASGWDGGKLIENRPMRNFLRNNHVLYLDRDWGLHLGICTCQHLGHLQIKICVFKCV